MGDTIQEDGLDIIGDVHGCLPALQRLLLHLGYFYKGDCYQHKRRKAVFVGDIVDRGAHVRESLLLVKAMVEAGSAYMVLGNHELNLLNSSVYSVQKGDYLRSHTPHNMNNLKASFASFRQHKKDQAQLMGWLRTLPLWFDAGQIRVAHASWDEHLRQSWLALYGDAPLSDDILTEAVTHDTLANRVVKLFTCGSTVRLPAGYKHMCSDGCVRRRIRAKFWIDKPETYGSVIFPPEILPEKIASTPLSDVQKRDIHYYHPQETPLVVGHYALVPNRNAAPLLLSSNIACVDYSCFTFGTLFCYRYRFGNNCLTPAQFVDSS